MQFIENIEIFFRLISTYTLIFLKKAIIVAYLIRSFQILRCIEVSYNKLNIYSANKLNG